MLAHLDPIDCQLAALDARLEDVAGSERWAAPVNALRSFRGIATLTALGLIAEIGDFARFGHPRELASWLGICPTEYSSGEPQHRGHITKTGNRHARRLLIEAAWHYRHAPRRPTSGPDPSPRAWEVKRRSACTTATDTSPHRANDQPSWPSPSPASSAAFLWAELTNQPARELQEATAA